MKCVVIESPYAGDVKRNEAYGRACMLHSLRLGEAPYLSHLLYTQVLDDLLPADRVLGINAGLRWASKADGRVFYIDLGMSPGMCAAREFYEREAVPYETRELGAPWSWTKGAHR